MKDGEVVKTNIKPEDVAKVMKEYDKKAQPGGPPPTLPKKSAGSLEDAISAEHKKLDPKAPIVDKPKPEQKGSKSKEVEKIKAKHTEPKGPKTVLIDMTTINTDVTFTGSGWKALDIKLATAALIRAFRIKIRDEYRKGNK
jgi:hypothetical protein